MGTRIIAAVALYVFLVVPAAGRAEENDPCAKQWQGQRLADNLYNVDIMVKLLAHLNGREDPKVKRLVEINLQWAAAGSREAIDQGAVLASPYFALNFIRPVQEARLYVSQHKLAKMPSAPDRKSESDIEQNLKVVEAWLQKNQ